MSDIVKQLLFRSSDEAGIGWTPTTVVHVPAGLLHQAADEITALSAEVERLIHRASACEEVVIEQGGRLGLLHAENERLRDELSQTSGWLDVVKTDLKSITHQRDKMLTENERLRAIVKVADAMRNGIRDAGVKRLPQIYMVTMAFDAARGALEEKP